MALPSSDLAQTPAANLQINKLMQHSTNLFDENANIDKQYKKVTRADAPYQLGGYVRSLLFRGRSLSKASMVNGGAVASTS